MQDVDAAGLGLLVGREDLEMSPAKKKKRTFSFLSRKKITNWSVLATMQACVWNSFHDRPIQGNMLHLQQVN